jgi:hypothetical protein
LSIVLAVQLLSLSVGLTLFVLSSRNTLGFLPIRDYAYFIDAAEQLPVHGSPAAREPERTAFEVTAS